MAAEKALADAATQIPWKALLGLGGAGLGLGAAGAYAGKGMQGLTGTPGQTKQFDLLRPQQQNLQNQAVAQAMGLLQGGGIGKPSYEGFQPIAQQARTQFQTQTVPQLLERFTGMGANRGSSGLQGALGSAGAGLEQGLAALQSQYGLQQQGLQQNLLNQLLGYGLQPSQEQAYFPEQPGFLETSGQAILQAIPYLLMLL